MKKPQGTFGWFKARYAKVSMSDGVNTLMHGGFVAKNSLLRNIRERMQHTDEQIMAAFREADQISNRVESLAWGHDSEGKGVAYYELTRGADVQRPGFVVHSRFYWCGGSPDFLEIDDSSNLIVGEVKCPATSAIHLQYLGYRKISTEHYNQVQGNIAVTGADSGKFLSFDPRQELESKVLSVVNVPKDPDWQRAFFLAATEFDHHMRNGSFYDNPLTKAVDGLPSMF